MSTLQQPARSIHHAARRSHGTPRRASSKFVLAGVAVFAWAGPLMAADLPAAPQRPVYKAPAAAAPFSWTGFYAGLNAGGAVGRSNDPTSTPFSATGFFTSGQVADANAAGAQTSKPAGFLGGVQAGYNLQSGWLVGGVEADFDYFGQRGSNSGGGFFQGLAPTTFAISSEVKTDWLATMRGRVGVAANNWLFYATGGGAFANLRGNFAYTNNCLQTPACAPGFPQPAPLIAEATSLSQTKAGYTIGGGVEAALGGNWSLKAEYLYVTFGGISGTGLLTSIPLLVPTTSNNPLTHSLDLSSHIGRVGINYRFGG
jgi:outer membrane immunogenic protein